MFYRKRHARSATILFPPVCRFIGPASFNSMVTSHIDALVVVTVSCACITQGPLYASHYVAVIFIASHVRKILLQIELSERPINMIVMLSQNTQAFYTRPHATSRTPRASVITCNYGANLSLLCRLRDTPPFSMRGIIFELSRVSLRPSTLEVSAYSLFTSSTRKIKCLAS